MDFFVFMGTIDQVNELTKLVIYHGFTWVIWPMGSKMVVENWLSYDFYGWHGSHGNTTLDPAYSWLDMVIQTVISINWGVPQVRWMVLVNGKIPSFEMDDDLVVPLCQETSILTN